MSPQKGEKLPSVPPEKKSAKPKPKVVVMDHDKLTIEMVDDIVDRGIYKFPKYRPNNAMNMFEDGADSPKKSEPDNTDEELKIYDKL